MYLERLELENQFYQHSILIKNIGRNLLSLD